MTGAGWAADDIIVTGHGDPFQISSPQRWERTKVRGFISFVVSLSNHERLIPPGVIGAE